MGKERPRRGGMHLVGYVASDAVQDRHKAKSHITPVSAIHILDSPGGARKSGMCRCAPGSGQGGTL